ncbi:MAG: flagellar motor protein MotB [Minwuia sp.]|uniref:flagellar motor protein MotB n=1 Tax=Minwuia sp. TaxID=2493630 RepID=UPI003A8B43DD
MTRSAWLIAFADLSAVLCAFFVLMLAMSDFDAPALSSLATVFGKDEGDWVADRPASGATAEGLRRTGADSEQTDYLAAIAQDRIERADWPWTIERRSGSLALRQVLQPGGIDLPADMAAWLRTAGYPIAVAAVMSGRSARLAATQSAFDEGLRAAGALASELSRQGVARNIPVRTRFAAEPAPLTLEIVMRVGEENQ